MKAADAQDCSPFALMAASRRAAMSSLDGSSPATPTPFASVPEVEPACRKLLKSIPAPAVAVLLTSFLP